MRWQPESVVTISLPGDMLERYIDVALRVARPSQTDTGAWYFALDRFPGVWGDGESRKACLDALEEVLKEWLVIKLANGDTDIPVVDEIDLTAIARR